MQSTITAWLRKPASVTQAPRSIPPSPPPPPPPPASVQAIASAESSINALPTPPPEETTAQKQTYNSTKSHEATPSLSFAATTNPPLIRNITLELCTSQTLPSLKRLNTLLLQIPYPKTFYDEILADPVTKSITLLAIWRDDPTIATNTTTAPTPPSQAQQDKHQAGRVVGGIRCRLLGSEALDTGHSGPLLYISSLAVLSPYRHYGIATHLLSAVTATALEKYGVKAVGAHVWTENREGRAWYAKRGFCEERVQEGYYRRLNPGGAVVVRRVVRVGDLLGR